jgi:GNAT superfamily N-acetyltransferase
MDIEIRPMTDADIPSVSDIVSACHRFLAEEHGYSDDQVAALLRDRSSEDAIASWPPSWSRWVAERQGSVVGVVAVEGNEIHELFVRPENHRQGIGRKLFTAAEEAIRAAGHTALTVNTTGYATPFYQRMGARVIDHHECPNGPLQGRTLTRLKKQLS